MLYPTSIGDEVENNEVNDSSIVHTNNQYGFTFTLPESWEGYSIVESAWQGNPISGGAATSGVKFIVRHPDWTESAPREDMPVLVFTTTQWDAYVAEEYSVSAAPILASELARNNKYVFALPARWDFDYSPGYEEAQDIIEGSPLKAFDI